MKTKTPKNIYVRRITKTTCSNCNTRKTEVLSLGEYIRGKWHTVGYICPDCCQRLLVTLHQFISTMKRPISFIPYQGYIFPEWFKQLEIRLATIEAETDITSSV